MSWSNLSLWGGQGALNGRGWHFIEGDMYFMGSKVNMTLRSSPMVQSMWPCKLRWDDEKSKHAGLA